MSARIDLTGQTFGLLTVIRFDRSEKIPGGARAYWICRCACDGKEVSVCGQYLRNGDTTSCGCVKRNKLADSRRGRKFGPSARRLELTGQKWGKLTVLGLDEVRDGASFWNCVCECGERRSVEGSKLTSGHSASCGRCVHPGGTFAHETKHGASRRGKKSPEYITWCSMKKRCHNPNDSSYVYYGARGTVVCQQWRDSFSTFFADMGPRPTPQHSIDRFPNKEGNYEPGNCRWATDAEQNSNRRAPRTSGRILITHNGETHSAHAWAKIVGVSDTLIKHRLRIGLPVEEVLRRKNI